MWYLRAAVIAALFVMIGTTGLRAQDIVLRTADGTVEISGQLLGFNGELYRLDTAYGELTMDAQGIICQGAACPNPDTFIPELSISGADTMGTVLMPALIESFALRSGLSAIRETHDTSRFTYTLAEREAKTPVARIHVHATDTDEGFADLLAEEADIVMAMRQVRTDEASLAREIGLGDLNDPNRSLVLALDALLPVVAPGNPVSDVSLSDLLNVLNGKITNWSAFGAPDSPITLRLRDHTAGVTQVLQQRFLTPVNATLPPGIQFHATNAELDQAITSDVTALGVVQHSEMARARPLPLIGSCGFGQTGTRTSIKAEDYALTIPLFLYVPARRLPQIGREFLSFTRSAPAQIVIRRAGFVDQAPEEMTIDDQGQRMANAITVAKGTKGLAELKRMVTTLGPMKRISTSFRFETGSTGLDAQSLSNVRQLARALARKQYSGRQILFAGFSDSEGAPDANARIAQRRADAAQKAVLNALAPKDRAGITIDTVSFGAAMPMACDDTVWGRQVNRRVEVWVQ